MRRIGAGVKKVLLLAAVLLVILGVVAGYVFFPQVITPQLVPLLAVILLIAAGFLYYESKKPGAKEITAVAVLSAVAVAGRILFAPLPNFKPVGAVVIVAGVVFGPAAGFMTGAVSALCSNMMFGQGAWTPWQMLGFGVVGALAGVLGKRNLLKGKLRLCAYGAAAGYLYGIIVDAFYILGYVAPTWATVWAAVLGGVIFNTIHAGANVLFLFIIGEAWIKKLMRIKDR